MAASLGVDVDSIPDTRGRHANHAKGSTSGRWNSGRIVSSHGYVKIRVGRGHRLADPNGYAYEHLLVWVSSGRSAPLAGEVLHHKNEDTQDNRLENLELKTKITHGKDHISQRKRDNRGRVLPKKAGRLLDGREWSEMP